MKLQQSVLKLAVLAAALTTAAAAQAVPYAYASIAFTGITLSGLQNATVAPESVITQSGANYPLAPGVSQSGAMDVAQSFVGPGAFPAENTFTAEMTNAFGTRGDALLIGSLLAAGGMSANAVAEGRLGPFPNAVTASSNGGTSTALRFNFTTSTTTDLVLQFSASDLLAATTNATGDSAKAGVSSSFSIASTANTPNYLDNFAPGALNIGTSSDYGFGDGNITNSATTYSHTFTVGPGTYQFSFLTGAQQFLSDPSPVPEPAPLALLGIGALGVAMSRKRKNTKAA